MDLTKEYAQTLDHGDALNSFRELFHIPRTKNGDEFVYLVGNSLGLQPKSTATYIQQELDDWANYGVEGHFLAANPWMPYHTFLREKMAKIVGADPMEVVVMNSLTVNLHLLMVSFYKPTKTKYKIIIEDGVFPSDDYAVQSQARFHGFDPQDAIVRLAPANGLFFEANEVNQQIERYGDRVALVLWGGVNYKSGQVFDLKSITDTCHKFGIVAGFDLAHMAGNIPCSLGDSGADFAAWCTYKYLNSGPGSLSGVFVNKKYSNKKEIPRFEGWWGHDQQSRFLMDKHFIPMEGADAWQLSNPPILSMAAIKASLDIFDRAEMQHLRQKSIRLTGYLADLLVKMDENNRIKILTPPYIEMRGCQLSLAVTNADKAFIHLLYENGIMADWREPNIVRVAPVPLYNSFLDVWKFVNVLIRLANAL